MIPEKKRIHSKKDLKEWIMYERSIYKFNKLNIFSEQRIIYKYLRTLRKLEYYTNTNKKVFKIIYKIELKKMQYKYQIKIPINTCEKGIRINHIGSILVNGNSSVGKDCTFHINTALVAKGISGDAPILGDGVVVGFGAVVLGNVKIANNVAIGANSVVTKSILEEDIAVGGIPAKKVSNNGTTKWVNRRKKYNE